MNPTATGRPTQLKQNRPVRNGLVLSSAGYVATALGFAFWILVTNLLPKHDVGLAISLLAILPIIQVIGNLGASDSITRYAANHRFSWQFLRPLAFQSAWLAAIAALVSAFVLHTLVFAMAPSGSGFLLWVVIVIAQVGGALCAAISVAHGSPNYYLTSTLSGGVAKIVAFVMVQSFGLGALSVLLAFAVGGLVELLLHLVLLRSHITNEPIAGAAKAMSSYRISNWISSTVSLLLNGSLPSLFVVIGGAEFAADVGVALMILAAMTMVSSSLARNYLARSSVHPEMERRTWIASFGAAAGIAVLLWLAALAGATNLLFVFGPRFTGETAQLVSGFAFVAILMVPNYFLDSKLNFWECSTHFAFTNIVGAVLNIVSVAVAIYFSPENLVYGMCIGQILYTCCAIASVAHAKRRKSSLATPR